MDIGEGVAKLVVIMEKGEKCDYKPDKTEWKANLSGSGKALAGYLGNKPHASSEATLSNASWPSQAHHLIPHLTIKSHLVAKWLKTSDYLFSDTYYNVDHRNNGKWMPYASSLPEWVKGATRKADIEKNRVLMFKVMGLAKIQLHQGKHSSSNRYGIGETSYKKRVAQYLDKIRNNATSHYAGTPECSDCGEKKQSGKYPPRKNTVKYVDKASELIEEDIDCCRIFVSRIAAEFTEVGGFSLEAKV